MSNSKSWWDYFFLGFGLLTIISGVFLIIGKDYFIGVCGSAVGVWLVLMNIKNFKS